MSKIFLKNPQFTLYTCVFKKSFVYSNKKQIFIPRVFNLFKTLLYIKFSSLSMFNIPIDDFTCIENLKYSNDIYNIQFQPSNFNSWGNLSFFDIKESDLINARILEKKGGAIKILGEGELKSIINISISYASKSAKDKITKIGGSINLTVKEKAK